MPSELLINVISLLIFLIIGYLISYFKEKGKLQALSEENKKLTMEVENIKQKYALDLQKRKYKYETKQKLYYEFMNKLDNYNALQMNLLFDELGSLMMKFFESKSDEEKNQFTIKFNNTARDIDTKIKKQSSELFSQLNELKLTANDETITILNKLQNELNISNKKFVKMAHNIPELLNNPNIKNELQQADNQTTKNIISIKNQLIQVLKNELDNI
ncbi:hypothetical protein [Aliarcobacter butzleri]|uniref:hypothetical protein n=1 Tax=Aliarcobacter butzleri TaxID=28197 RepID=UPI003B2259BF